MRASGRYGPYLRLTKTGKAVIDKAVIRTKERLDGKFVVHSNDDTLSPEDMALGYKQLMRVEQAWRTLKSGLKLRPVYHYTLPFYGLLSLGLYLLAARLVRPTRRWRIRRREALWAVVALLVLATLVAVPFVATAHRYELRPEGTPTPALLRPFVGPVIPEVPVREVQIVKPVQPSPTPTPPSP